jgi:hypothetical protein
MNNSFLLKSALFGFCLIVLFQTYQSLILGLRATIHWQDLMNSFEAILAILAYLSLVGITYLIWDAYSNFRRSSLPDMSFDSFKDEPQFALRDFSASNQADSLIIEELKNRLGMNKKPISLEEIVAEAENYGISQINQANKRRKNE